MGTRTNPTHNGKTHIGTDIRRVYVRRGDRTSGYR